MDQVCQTTFILIFSQKRLKPTKLCLEAVNSFVSVSMVKMFQNPIHLTNYKSQRCIRSVQTTLIPIFSQKMLKPTKICLEAVNSFVSVFMVKMFHNPMYLTNYKRGILGRRVLFCISIMQWSTWKGVCTFLSFFTISPTKIG